jgi:2-polyprenyl-6-hydroxyphenyl methylase/3-demethylubiquinone-9 3-methyltransferase
MENIAASIDLKEIEKFSKMAEAWWDETGDFRPLHKINPVRIGYILERVENWRIGELEKSKKKNSPILQFSSSPVLNGLRLLDIGCGGGLLSEPMARLGAKVTGIDASGKNIEIAKLHAAGEGLEIDYRIGSVDHIPPTTNHQPPTTTFDLILNMEVIEHVADVPGFIKGCSNLLAPGGMMIISTMNRTLKSLLLAKIGAEYILRWLPIGTHDWNKFLKPGEIEPLLRENGLELKELKGMSYSPFKDEWFLSDDISVNYFLVAVRSDEPMSR